MKQKLKGAQTGHSLLKRKSEALTKRFRDIVRKIDDVSFFFFSLAWWFVHVSLKYMGSGPSTLYGCIVSGLPPALCVVSSHSSFDLDFLPIRISRQSSTYEVGTTSIQRGITMG